MYIVSPAITAIAVMSFAAGAAAAPSWSLGTWRCDPALSGDNDVALSQRRFSVTIGRVGALFKWSVAPAQGTTSSGSGKVRSLKPHTIRKPTTDQYGVQGAPLVIECVTVVTNVTAEADFARFSLCKSSAAVIWMPDHEDGMLRADDMTKAAICHGPTL